MRCQLCCSSLAHWWHQGASNAALVWGWKSTNFTCEAVWLLLHRFSKHLGNPGPLLSPSSFPWFYGLAKAMWGWGSYGVLCMSLHVQMWMCHFVLCKKDGLCKAEYSFTVLICHGARVPYSLPMPKLSRYFECWLPHPQTVDTELLSQRLAEYQHSVPECMHGCAASALF